MPPSTDDRPPTRLPVLSWVLLLAAATAIVWFVYAVANRLVYPYELEWMEGAMVDHASRIAEGLPLYCEPRPEHVPFLYAPLLFWLGGAAMALGVDGLLALRLIALLGSVGSALLIGHWVRRDTGRIVPGLCAVGLFFAGYGWLAWWYDLARNDGLFVLAMLGAGYQLRHGGARRWLWAAALATCAFLAKQSALMWLPALAVGALCHDWRPALRFAAAAAAGIGGAVLAMHLTSDGWSTFYLFEMPGQHGWNSDHTLAFWTQDLMPMLPLLALGLGGFVWQWRRGQRREALLLAAFGSGGLLTSWLSRLHVGGFDNVLMYGFVAACVLGPIAAATNARGWRQLAALLLLVQFAWLGAKAWQREPSVTLLPSAAHRRAHQELAEFVARQDGPVWIPAHGGITYRLQGGTGAHGQAIFDLLQALPKDRDGMLDLTTLIERQRLDVLPPRVRTAITGFVDRVDTLLREHAFAAIVVDEVGGVGSFPAVFYRGVAGPDGRLGSDDDSYVRRDGALLSEPGALKPLLGYEVHSPYVLVPGK